MAELSKCDLSGDTPDISVPRDYNCAVDFVDRNVIEGRGDKIAVIDDAGEYSYAEMAERVNRAGNMLKGLGVQQEQRVLICLLDSVNFPACVYGAMKMGAVPIPANTLLTSKDYDYILRDSRAKVAIVQDELLEKFLPVIEDQPHLEHVLVCGDPGGSDFPALESLMGQSGTELSPADTTADDVGFWLYSSGTTGRPKGVVHAHRDPVYTAALYGMNVLGLSEADTVFSAAKLFFAYGLGNAMNFPFYAGATAVLMRERPTPESVTAVLEKHRPTFFFGVPTLYGTMLAHDGLDAIADDHDLRRCVSAGEALPRDIAERWHEKMGIEILDGIGSTEMLQTFLANGPGYNKPGTSGLPVPGYALRIVDDEGRDVEDGDMGELWVNGPSTAMYYWNQKEKSRRTFYGEWLRSGDKYRRDEDGYYVYCGRADDMLKVGGIWVSPFEVESALVKHEAVLEAAVVGRADDDEMIKPEAWVILKNGFEGDDDLAEDIKQYVKSNLAPFKYPRWVQFVDDLPKTATGKIQRYKLRS